jgi:hypothetical protein
MSRCFRLNWENVLKYNLTIPINSHIATYQQEVISIAEINTFLMT